MDLRIKVSVVEITFLMCRSMCVQVNMCGCILQVLCGDE